MKTVLCVIDVQPRFNAAELIISDVVYQIQLAITRKSPILIVEYGLDHCSHNEIYKALNYYSPHLWDIVKKTSDNGSYEVITKMKSKGFLFNRVRICGVNTCACVRSTALGLKQSGLFNRVEVAENAVNCAFHHYACYEDLIYDLQRRKKQKY